MKSLISVLVAIPLFHICSCKGKQLVPTPSAERRMAAAAKAIAALQAARFDQAGEEAKLVLDQDRRNPQALVVWAISHYKKTMHNLVQDLRTSLAGMFEAQTINHRYIQWSLTQADQELYKVEEALAQVSEQPSFFLQLCLACWQYDWNHNGQIDQQDLLLFQVELDAQGEPIPKDDARRKPTFRFDPGDIFWARAMLSFQRAFLNLLLAYQLPEMNELLTLGQNGTVKIKLVKKPRVHQAKELILAGLENADRARREYLDEKDDQGEWLPNPTQKNHPLPLPVDETLYQTWKDVLNDLLQLLKGEVGISVAEVAQLGDHQWKDPPRGYIHVAKLFEDPGDITLDLTHLRKLNWDRTRQDVERVLQDIFGDKYVREIKMKPTLLISRLKRMKNEVERGEESLERKLRYLLWIN